MQNTEIGNAIPRNPWHNCKNCVVYKTDRRYGRDASIITGGKPPCELKDKDCPPGSPVKLCFSSDLFIREAGEWRAVCRDFIRRRADRGFVAATKRPERIRACVPSDRGAGRAHFHLRISIENQETADRRLPHFLDAPLTRREAFCSPLIGPMEIRHEPENTYR